MGKVQKTENELLEDLKEQLDLLKILNEKFDEGVEGAAKPISVGIRVLLHDLGLSKSLLGQLGFKENINYFNSSSEFNPSNLAEFDGLVVVGISSNNMSYKAPLDEVFDMPWRRNEFISFQDWWDGVIIKDSRGNLFSRQQLIRNLANKDGGAHIDPELNLDYDQLKKGLSTQWAHVKEVNGIEESAPPIGLHLHSTRQIAFELIFSIEKYMTENGLH